MTALAAAARGVDRVLGAYIGHCQRMDAWARRRRRARILRKLHRRARWASVLR